MSDIIAMTKNGETLGVHSTCVEDHQRIGWTVGGDLPDVDPDVVIDPLDHDNDGKKGGSAKPEGDLAELRVAYQAKVGKKPFAGWDADELRRRMAEAGN